MHDDATLRSSEIALLADNRVRGGGVWSPPYSASARRDARMCRETDDLETEIRSAALPPDASTSRHFHHERVVGPGLARGHRSTSALPGVWVSPTSTTCPGVATSRSPTPAAIAPNGVVPLPHRPGQCSTLASCRFGHRHLRITAVDLSHRLARIRGTVPGSDAVGHSSLAPPSGGSSSASRLGPFVRTRRGRSKGDQGVALALLADLDWCVKRHELRAAIGCIGHP